MVCIQQLRGEGPDVSLSRIHSRDFPHGEEDRDAWEGKKRRSVRCGASRANLASTCLWTAQRGEDTREIVKGSACTSYEVAEAVGRGCLGSPECSVLRRCYSMKREDLQPTNPRLTARENKKGGAWESKPSLPIAILDKTGRNEQIRILVWRCPARVEIDRKCLERPAANLLSEI